jgi:hypothetical protein
VRSRRSTLPHAMEQDRLPDLAQALLDFASLSAQILTHMARWQGHTAPDAPPREQAFRELLTETLRPVSERHPLEALEAAQRIVAEAVETIEAEILLVEPPGRDREQRLRPRTPRRPL